MANPAVAEKLVHQQQRLGLCLKTGLLIDISAKHVPSDYVRLCVRCRDRDQEPTFTAVFPTTLPLLAPLSKDLKNVFPFTVLIT